MYRQFKEKLAILAWYLQIAFQSFYIQTESSPPCRTNIITRCSCHILLQMRCSLHFSYITSIKEWALLLVSSGIVVFTLASVETSIRPRDFTLLLSTSNSLRPFQWEQNKPEDIVKEIVKSTWSWIMLQPFGSLNVVKAVKPSQQRTESTHNSQDVHIRWRSLSQNHVFRFLLK